MGHVICRHARKRQTALARKYAAIASGTEYDSTIRTLYSHTCVIVELKLVQFTSYLSLRGLVRFTECCLILWRLTAGKVEHRTEAKKVYTYRN